MSVRYLTDEAGEQIAVVLEVEAYRQLMEELEELEALRAFDHAKAATGEDAEVLALEDALAEIEHQQTTPRAPSHPEHR